MNERIIYPSEQELSRYSAHCITAIKIPDVDEGIIILKPFYKKESDDGTNRLKPSYFWPKGTFEGKNPSARVMIASRDYPMNRVGNLYNGFRELIDTMRALHFFKARFSIFRVDGFTDKSELEEKIRALGGPQ